MALFLVYAGIFTPIAGMTYACLSNSTCGCSANDAVLTKIIGGEPVGIDTWGWAVSIRVWNHHICGGSLISPTLVITAAHCLLSIGTKSSLSVTAGSKYLSAVRQQRSIADVYLHRQYDARIYLNDIALLRLSSALTMTDHSIARICLPSSSSQQYPSNNQVVVAIGWGVLSADDKASSDILQQVTLNTISDTAANCQRSTYDSRVQLCAGVKGGGKGRIK